MGVTIGLFIATLLFAFCGILAGRIHYKNTFNLSYSYRAMFPFEYNYKTPIFKNFYCNISIILSAISSVGFLISACNPFNNGYLIFSMIAGTIFAIFSTFLFFVGFEFMRFHFVAAAVEMVFSFAFSGGIALAGLNMFQKTNKPLPLVIMILALISFVFLFALLINPKLTMIFKAEKKIDENGNETLVRPKFIMLAFAEWCAYFVNLFNIILLFIFVVRA